MKKAIRLIATFLLILIIFFTLFFLWASSPNLSEKEYSKLITNPIKSKTKNDSLYSIITYNIGYLSGMTNNRAVEKPKSLFESNLKKVNYLLDSLNADVIAFQEIDYASKRSFKVNQQDEIAKLGYTYIAQSINWDEKYLPFPYWPPSLHFGEMLSGQSILSKFPLKEHKRIVLNRVANAPFYRDALYLERLAQVVKTSIENKEVIIINTHLEAFDEPTRIQQLYAVLSLFKKYAADYPTFLLGDFNSEANSDDSAIQELISMPDVGNAAFDKNNIENTFSSIDPFKRIDYIFYTKSSIEYIEGKVLKEFGDISDHLPVYMKFRLK